MVQEKGVWAGKSGGAGGCGVSSEVVLGEGYTEGGVCGEVERGVPFAPISALVWINS